MESQSSYSEAESEPANIPRESQTSESEYRTSSALMNDNLGANQWTVAVKAVFGHKYTLKDS